MQTLTEIRQLLAERGLTPRHRLGQNFLHDKNQLTKLVEAANIQPNDLILEVGPGTGTLTEALLERGANVIACELDEQLADLLHERLDGRITLIRGDALDKHRRLNPFIIEALNGRAFQLVANLPYQIASPLISSLLTDHPNCRGICVTIQKEVAERLMAKPSSKEYGSLTIIVQAFADVKLLSTLSPSCFWPPPEVTSAMVSVTPKRSTSIESGATSSRAFSTFITQLFSKRRKQLGTIFGRQHVGWMDNRLQPLANLRPDAISVEQAIALWQAFARE